MNEMLMTIFDPAKLLKASIAGTQLNFVMARIRSRDDRRSASGHAIAGGAICCNTRPCVGAHIAHSVIGALR